MYIPVDSNTNLVRDDVNKAILNRDLVGLETYKEYRNRARAVDKNINDLQEEVKQLHEMVRLLISNKKVD